jgi:hypothetical protein
MKILRRIKNDRIGQLFIDKLNRFFLKAFERIESTSFEIRNIDEEDLPLETRGIRKKKHEHEIEHLLTSFDSLDSRPSYISYSNLPSKENCAESQEIISSTSSIKENPGNSRRNFFSSMKGDSDKRKSQKMRNDVLKSTTLKSRSSLLLGTIRETQMKEGILLATWISSLDNHDVLECE